MRTKTLLIATAAALAAGIISSQAQVYSQNIVGYVNLTAAPSKYTQIDVPLQASTNSPEILFTALQAGDAILLWNGISYQTYTYFSAGQWLYPDGSTIGAAPNIATGKGLFYQNNQGATETNTIVGTAVLSNTNSPVTFSPGAYSLVGSLPPLGVSSLDDTNLNLPTQPGDAVLLWNGTSYQTYTFFSTGNWLYPNGSTIGAAPGLQVGQGFFYQNNQGSAEQWKQNLIVQ